MALNEYHIVESIVTQVFQASRHTFVCGLWSEPYVSIVNRQDKSALRRVQYPGAIPTRDSEFQCTDLLPLPGFDLEQFPYALFRTNRAINLVDLRAGRTYNLITLANQSGTHSKMCLVP